MQAETHDVVLVAEDVRRRVFAGLTPIAEAAVAGLEPRTRELVQAGTTCAVQALVQLHPPIVRIIVVGDSRAVEIERVPGGIAPELVQAAEHAIAGFLAAMRPEAAAELVNLAAALRTAGQGGGFVLLADFSDGEVSAVLNVDPRDLASSVVLGSIADATPTRTH